MTKKASSESKLVKVVVVVSGDGHYRAGRKWDKGKNEAEVTPEQLKQLKDDPRLTVVGMDDDKQAYGSGLNALYSRAKDAVDLLNTALGDGGSASLTLKGWKPESAQEGHEGGSKPASQGKGASKDGSPAKTADETAKANALPEGLPYKADFEAAGKTWPDVLEMAAKQDYSGVANVGAARAAEVDAWIKANVDESGQLKAK